MNICSHGLGRNVSRSHRWNDGPGGGDADDYGMLDMWITYENSSFAEMAQSHDDNNKEKMLEGVVYASPSNPSHLA